MRQFSRWRSRLAHSSPAPRPRSLLPRRRARVTAALADHRPVTPAFAYRFDCPDRSIVFSGDTRRSDDVIRLAQGADVLVHEAMYPAGVDRVAAAASVKTLVLSHLVPADDPEITDSMWIEAARPYFSGTILVARDGMEL